MKDYHFSIDLPVTQLRTLVGNLTVNAIINRHWQVDINTIVWDGKDITPLVINMPEMADVRETVHNAMHTYVNDLTTYQRWQIENYGNMTGSDKPGEDDRGEKFASWYRNQEELELIKQDY